ncbi:MAG TPA: hypothetical protein VGP08_09990 [Pyrinomonadaceae bacterium]|jgi:hypothetical protein|nr:hypothetical protein [Pyrinomonadaceae bacterium]
MRRLFIAAVGVVICFAAFGAGAARVRQDASARARELAAAFSKSKHVVKERHGIRVEKFREIRSEPAPKTDARLYSGEYEADNGALSLRVYADSRAEADGTEPAEDFTRTRKFKLVNARVEGALLTGTKVYEDGSSEAFEGVFINRTDRNSPDDPGTTAFGLGVLFDPPKSVGGLAMGRLFYALKR